MARKTPSGILTTPLGVAPRLVWRRPFGATGTWGSLCALPTTTYRDYPELAAGQGAPPNVLLTFQMALPMMVPLSGGTVSSPSMSATRQWPGWRKPAWKLVQTRLASDGIQGVL